ncbi:uncharacterized protein LOC127259074 [Andrographis paniculata]|uniref:uncharacterized protein LOC127259074 n=1 Tax=Andrographis paniculata TaxID=175694 RepID=UPI0021E952A0|nr:uncharacterized protein LOC127259074 [Andrographis paniculata]
MSSNGEASAKGGGGHRSSKSCSRSQKAGLNFPVGRIERLLREGNPATRFSAGAPVYLAAVLEYLALEVLELAGDTVKQANKTRITPTQIQVAVQTDNELREVFGNATIPSAGDTAKQANKTRITPTHIQVAVQTDNELRELFGNATIPSAGLSSNTRAEFFPESGEGNQRGDSTSF